MLEQDFQWGLNFFYQMSSQCEGLKERSSIAIPVLQMPFQSCFKPINKTR